MGVTAFRSKASDATQIGPESVGVVDQNTSRIVAEIAVGFSSSLIAAGEDAIWLLDAEGSTLTKIDPTTNARDSPTGIPVSGVPTGLAAGEGSVWIALNEGSVLSVLELGPDLGELRQRIQLARRDRVFPVNFASVPLTVGEGAVWALERGLGRVRRIDPATGKFKTFAEGVGTTSSIVVDGRAVWLGGTLGVTKLDLHTGQRLGSEAVAPVHESATTSIAVGRDAVWFVGDSSTDLWRIDPLSVSIVASDPIGASPNAVAVADDGVVWVGGGSSTSVWRLDPETNEPKTIEVGATSGGLVADFGRIWTSPGASSG